MCGLLRHTTLALLGAACTGDIVAGSSMSASPAMGSPSTHTDAGILARQPADTADPAMLDASVHGSIEAGVVTPMHDAGSVPEADPAADAATTGVQPDVCDTALFCDDFEDDSVGQGPSAPWKSELNGGALSVDDAKPFRGSRSVHVTVPASTYARAYMTLAGAPVFPVADDTFYGRMMVYIVAAPTGAVHWTNLEAEGDVAGQSYRSLYRYGGMHDDHLLANYETRNVASDCWQNSDSRMPVGRWTCIEWRFDTPHREMRLWIDGQAIDDQTVQGRGQGCISNGTNGDWVGPHFDTLRVGWEHYQQTDAKEMWIDDVAIGTERLGCPSP